MATERGIASRKRGLGTAQLAVLRAIADGQATEMDMRLVLKPYASGATAQAVLHGLRACGLIGWHRRGDRYYLTGKGRAQLPVVVRQVPMAPYRVPQQPPRRPGSMEFATLPSIAAGKAREWRHPL